MRLPRRLPIVLGVALYAGMLTLVSLSVLQGDQHVGYSGARIRGATSDIGMLLTLLAAGPFVIWAAVASWKKK